MEKIEAYKIFTDKIEKLVSDQSACRSTYIFHKIKFDNLLKELNTNLQND